MKALQARKPARFAITALTLGLLSIYGMAGPARAATTSTVTLRAHASLAENIGPIATLMVNGRLVGSIEIRSTTARDYTLSVPAIATGDKIDVVYANDTSANGDRNLWLASITVDGAQMLPNTAGVTYDRGLGAEAFDGRNVMPGQVLMPWNGAMRFTGYVALNTAAATPAPAPVPVAAIAAPAPAPVPVAAAPSPSVSTSPAASPAVAPAVSPAPAPATPAVATAPAAAPAPAPAPAAVVGVAPGPGVFVDAATGNDSNPGTFEKPWKTLAKAATAQVASGAGVYLKCGVTYRERLVLGTAQLQNGSIVAGYGNCAAGKAVISGADDFSGGWTKAGNIWQRRVPVTTPKITHLFVNGQAQRTAQFPNFVRVGNEYAIANAASPTSKAVLQANAADTALLAGRDIVGANLYVRNEPWFGDRRVVAAYDKASGTMTVDSATTYPMEGGNGYVLNDKQWMLDDAGEFFHDKANGVLYVWPKDLAAQTALNSALVEGTVRGNALELSLRANLVLRDIATVKTQSEALSLSNTAAITVDSVEVSDNGSTGLRIIRSSEGSVIRNSRFERNAYRAIDAAPVARVTLQNNVVADTGMSAYPGTTTAAVSNGPSGITQGNLIQRSAWSGMNYSATGGSKVNGNVVEDSCQRFSDGAGIYTWNGQNNTVNQSSLVENNIIVRAPGNANGAVGGGAGSCMGYYADDLSRQGVVRNNTIIDTPVGIYLHNASYMTIESNKVWLASNSGLWSNMDHTDRDTSIGNVIRGNQLNAVTTYSGVYPQVPTASTDVQPISIWHSLGGTSTITSGANTFGSNELLMLNGVSLPAASVRGPSGITKLSPDGWRKMNPAELPAKAPMEFNGYLASFGPELIANNDYMASGSGWSTWFAAAAPKGSLSLSTAIGCDGSCAVFNASTVYDVLSTPNFTMNSGALHLLQFRASLQSDGALNRPNVTMGNGMTSTTNLSGIAGNAIRYQGFFSAKSGSAGRINFGAQPGTKVGFDSVSLKQITGYTLARPRDWAGYAYAPAAASRSVDCSSLGWPSGCKVTDTNGTPVALPFTLPAGTARLLLRSDTALRRN